MFDDDLSASALFFSISGSTYRRRRNSSLNMNSDRFHVCVTVSILEHLHEVNISFIKIRIFLIFIL